MDFIANQILKNPPVLLGLIAALGFPDEFLEFMDQKRSKEQVIYTLPVEVEKTVELVLEGIGQELDAIENGTFTPVQEMRVSLQVDYLKEQLIANELVEVQEKKLVVSERGNQLKEGSKIRELVSVEQSGFQKNSLSMKFKDELKAFEVSKNELEKRGISPNVDSNKVIELVKENHAQEKVLQEQLTSQETNLTRYLQVKELLVELNKVPQKEQEKKKQHTKREDLER